MLHDFSHILQCHVIGILFCGSVINLNMLALHFESASRKSWEVSSSVPV